MLDTSKRGFASMDPEKRRRIASMGGQASGGNFANNPQRASEAGRKGGLRSHASRNQNNNNNSEQEKGMENM